MKTDWGWGFKCSKFSYEIRIHNNHIRAVKRKLHPQVGIFAMSFVVEYTGKAGQVHSQAHCRWWCQPTCVQQSVRESGHSLSHTCLFSVMALGWHLVQIPSGQGGWPSQPALILQLMFSNAANFPLKKSKIRITITMNIETFHWGGKKSSNLSAPPVSLRRYAWNDMCFTGGSRWFR